MSNNSYDSADLEYTGGQVPVIVGPTVRRVLPPLWAAGEDEKADDADEEIPADAALIQKLAQMQGVYDIVTGRAAIRAILNFIQPLHI